MNTSTISAGSLDQGASAGGQLHPRLIFIATAGATGFASSSHSLAGIDEVRFRRGTRSVERSGRVLTLAFPDDRMSSEHGRLIWHDARWVLDDPTSKNGSVVHGARARRAVLADGAVIELGRSFFVFRHRAVRRIPDHLASDADRGDLPGWPTGMATFSPDLADDLGMLARLASSPISIVLLGETGTGKDVTARGVHAMSRRAGELVAVNCGALPATLLEADLFGHRRGAFSGATADRAGLIRSADGGTLFLDEIAELPLAAQPALLRVLQQREVVPVGGDRAVPVDLRLISATLGKLDDQMANGRFREDLYARIAGHVTTLPPLRERREDLGLLLAALVPTAAGGRDGALSAPALRAILRHDWPHNIRELEQVLTRAFALASGPLIEPSHLPDRLRGESPRASHAAIERPGPALSPADRELRDHLVALLAAHQGNVVAVAKALDRRRAQIYRWVDRFALDLSAFRGG